MLDVLKQRPAVDRRSWFLRIGMATGGAAVAGLLLSGCGSASVKSSARESSTTSAATAPGMPTGPDGSLLPVLMVKADTVGRSPIRAPLFNPDAPPPTGTISTLEGAGPDADSQTKITKQMKEVGQIGWVNNMRVSAVCVGTGLEIPDGGNQHRSNQYLLVRNTDTKGKFFDEYGNGHDLPGPGTVRGWLSVLDAQPPVPELIPCTLDLLNWASKNP